MTAISVIRYNGAATVTACHGAERWEEMVELIGGEKIGCASQNSGFMEVICEAHFFIN